MLLFPVCRKSCFNFTKNRLTGQATSRILFNLVSQASNITFTASAAHLRKWFDNGVFSENQMDLLFLCIQFWSFTLLALSQQQTKACVVHLSQHAFQPLTNFRLLKDPLRSISSSFGLMCLSAEIQVSFILKCKAFKMALHLFDSSRKVIFDKKNKTYHQRKENNSNRGKIAAIE